MISDLSYL
jgi:hypothetical protein